MKNVNKLWLLRGKKLSQISIRNLENKALKWNFEKWNKIFEILTLCFLSFGSKFQKVFFLPTITFYSQRLSIVNKRYIYKINKDTFDGRGNDNSAADSRSRSGLVEGVDLVQKILKIILPSELVLEKFLVTSANLSYC